MEQPTDPIANPPYPRLPQVADRARGAWIHAAQDLARIAASSAELPEWSPHFEVAVVFRAYTTDRGNTWRIDGVSSTHGASPTNVQINRIQYLFDEGIATMLHRDGVCAALVNPTRSFQIDLGGKPRPQHRAIQLGIALIYDELDAAVPESVIQAAEGWVRSCAHLDEAIYMQRCFALEHGADNPSIRRRERFPRDEGPLLPYGSIVSLEFDASQPRESQRTGLIAPGGLALSSPGTLQAHGFTGQGP